MERKLGQSFQLSDSVMRNKRELLQKYVHAMQNFFWFIVMFVEKNNRNTNENRRYMFADISWMKKKKVDSAQAL